MLEKSLRKIRSSVESYSYAFLLCLILAMQICQPKTNVWVTSANASGLDTLCLSNVAPKKPFSTCLVGVPAEVWPIPKDIQKAVSGTFMGLSSNNFWMYGKSGLLTSPRHLLSLKN